MARIIEKRMKVESGYVYLNKTGERRIVVDMGPGGPNALVVWRTADSVVPLDKKTHGSCPLTDFSRWAESSQRASDEDITAFSRASTNQQQRRKEAAAQRENQRKVLHQKKRTRLAKEKQLKLVPA